MLLRGDKGKAIDVNQDQTACRATLVSAETVKIFTTDVDYSRQEDPHLLKSLTQTEAKSFTTQERFVAATCFQASKQNCLYVIAVNTSLLLFDTEV